MADANTTTQEQTQTIGDWYDETAEMEHCYHKHTAVSARQMTLLFRRACAIKGLAEMVAGGDIGETVNETLEQGELPRPVLNKYDKGRLLFAISEMADACICDMEEMQLSGRRGFEVVGMSKHSA